MDTRYHQAGRRWAEQPDGNRRLAVLKALGDMYVPSEKPPRNLLTDAPFWRRKASDLDIAEAVAGYIATRLPPADAEGLTQLLDVLGAAGIHRLPAPARRAAIAGLAVASADAARGLDGVRVLTLMLYYGLADANGTNPNWAALGYPGPPRPRSRPEQQLTPVTLPSTEDTTWDADVVIVGSGAGGGVVAGELARAGLDVVVLEAGAPVQTPDFTPYELEAFERLYWRGGYTPTVDGNVTMVAGATLGGGTTVNWTNCVPPPAAVREEWARVHRLEGLDGSAFDEHLRAVSERISVTDTCSDRNGPNERLRVGAEALGWSWRTASRNTDPGTYDAGTAGHMGFGDLSGSKRSTAVTYLVDAAAAGARLVTRCSVSRVLVEGGRAAGVLAWVAHDGGPRTTLTVRAPTVVVAGGALETPALLLRSGIGGPATGLHLHLHPVAALAAFYPEEQRAWWGPPQGVLVDEFTDLMDGYGFLIECSHFGTALAAASLPWRSGRDHKRFMAHAAFSAPAFGLLRDRGAGRVTIDGAGEGVVTYPVEDPLDRQHLRASLERVAQLQRAAGAKVIVDLGRRRTLWRRGDDLDAFVAALDREPYGAGGRPLFSAHQMGTARMGPDPQTSVADPDGQLHDVRGVWIGDTSAFPSAVGSNPMLTCMALARRTAHVILAARTRPGSSPAQSSMEVGS